ncbi:hypothetical protein [Pedobacter sp. L105]|uniref:hypothetical protein n=1 Tax=Pedobacter sp. L105 TaxID=1641871 RepID=UPI00131ACF6E|nr:hypothetical protein [Pedobacter sp. L105]
MDRKILVIAGMHRSGTSLISQWLYRCGLNLGDSLLGAAIGNIEGHFEDTDFLRFHEDTLAENNSSTYGFIHESISNLSRYQKEKLKGLVGFKSEMREQWGWKEPRTCLFLEHYREIIPDAYYLIIVRDFNATVSSLIHRDFKNMETKYLARNWFSRQIWKNIRSARKERKLYENQSEFYLNVWITYNEAILKNIQTLSKSQYIVTEHNSLCDIDTKLFDKLVNKWHFSLKYVDFKKVYKRKLLSDVTNIEPFVNDKALLEKAKNLQMELKTYLTNS